MVNVKVVCVLGMMSIGFDLLSMLGTSQHFPNTFFQK